jgi:hypothetical protein
MSYVCSICKVMHPCTVGEHNENWYTKVWMPEGAQTSIACHVLDHTECTVPMFCKCNCHMNRIDVEPPITSAPTNC